MDVSCHRPFLPGTTLEPMVIRTAKDSSFRRVMFKVKLSFVVNLLNVFPGMASKFFLKPFVTIPVALIVTGVILHFGFTFVVHLYINCCNLASLMLPFA